jgi:hypothetical protein
MCASAEMQPSQGGCRQRSISMMWQGRCCKAHALYKLQTCLAEPSLELMGVVRARLCGPGSGRCPMWPWAPASALLAAVLRGRPRVGDRDKGPGSRRTWQPHVCMIGRQWSTDVFYVSICCQPV